MVRLGALDGLRGLAALSVAAYHITLRYPAFMQGRPTPSTPLFPGFMQIEAGIVPVLWFFLISGFVIAWTIERCITPMDFVVSRVSRIYPAYWASIAVTVLAMWVFPLPGLVVTPGQVLVNATMLQQYFLIPDVAGVYWSLAVELLFYIYALALYAFGQWRHLHLVAFAWAVLGLLVAALEWADLPTSWRVNQLLLLHFVPFLAGGMMLYRLWRRQTPGWSAATLAVCTATIVLAFNPVAAALCLGAMGLIGWAAHGGLGWLAAPPLVWLGSVSYTLYLVHEYPSYMIMRALDARSVPHPAAMAAALIASFALAASISYAVERPAMRLIRGAWRRFRPIPGGRGPLPTGPAGVAPPTRPARPGSPG